MLTQERVRKLFSYDPEIGLFTRLVQAGNAVVGDVAGASHSGGYIRISVDRKLYQAHRLAWLYIYGYFPELQIDHKNGITGDNRLCNLREVSPRCNRQSCKVSSTNSSGFPGVCWAKQRQKWVANIKINQKTKHLGYYDTPLDAALARLTEEVWNPEWTCNHRSELVKAIKEAWPEFKV